MGAMVRRTIHQTLEGYEAVSDARIKVLLMIDKAMLGGGQRHVLQLVTGLDRDRFDVRVATESEGFLIDELRKKEITTHAIAIGKRVSRRAYESCVEAIAAFQPDIVHTHGGVAGVYGRLATSRHRLIKIVHTYHGIHYLHGSRLQRTLFSYIDRFMLKRTDIVICVAKSDFALGLKSRVVTHSKGHVITNGVDVDEFSSITRERTQGQFIVGTVARLHTQKGIEHLIRAARSVADNHANVRFHIVGDGELRPDLEKLVHTLGLESHIRFLGAQRDIKPFLGTLDLFVLPSLWEGFPYVLLEAMAARVPIVATHVDGIAEILQHGNDALLVEPKNPSMLAGAIVDSVTSDALRTRLSENAFRRVQTTFHVRDMVARIEALYAALIPG